MHVTLQLVDGGVRRATVEEMPKAKPAPIGRSELARITRDDDRRPLAEDARVGLVEPAGNVEVRPAHCGGPFRFRG